MLRVWTEDVWTLIFKKRENVHTSDKVEVLGKNKKNWKAIIKVHMSL